MRVEIFYTDGGTSSKRVVFTSRWSADVFIKPGIGSAETTDRQRRITVCNRRLSESWKKRPIYTNYTNNGHSVFVQTKNKKSRLISGGILGDRIYSFQQIHWHWGSNNNGSEHTVNGKRYSMEQHFVFYNTESENPVEDKHGIVVIALFYTRSKISNSQLEPVLNSGALGEPGETIKKEGGLSLYSFLPHIGGKGKFWSYKGSLTTPPCSENVLWIIFPTPRPVSSIQLKRFTTLKNFQGDFVKRNVRPTQPLNRRKVELLKFG
ncbi:anhydrase [Nesidiocoris tenuis]|uniref:carbonic anhydrase n=1 Tax=Nesidiocoris tenuis TaxID=355587 RepID=A0ABN7ANA9_9HEMI|nr:anhydrase [Nesidiocoris tenuis]